MIRLEMKKYNTQHNMNREAAKISTLLSSKIDKYEFHTGEEILPSDQSGTIEQANFMYSPLGNVLKNKQK